MQLSHLPPSIMDTILSNFASSFLVIKLWRCGDSLLRSKLSRGLTYLDLRLDKNLANITPFSAPALVSNLHQLRYLSVQSEAALLEEVFSWSNWIANLPKTLETLIIKTPDNELSIVVSNEGSVASGLENQKVMAPYRLMELDKYLPKLKTLKIGPKTTPHGRQSLGVDFTHLPPSLTHLRYPALVDYNPDPHGHYVRTMAVLPRSLVLLEGFKFSPHFEANLAAMFEDWLAAPPHLEFCSLRNTRNTLALEQLDWMPKTLKRADAEFQHFLPKLAVSLPTALESLTIWGVDPEAYRNLKSWTLYLPPTLTWLETSFYESEFILSHNIATLPRTLRHLKLQGTSDIDWTAVKDAMKTSVRDHFWPPQLESFHCMVLPLDSADVDLLPQTLTHLTIGLQGPLDASKLPPRLNWLLLGVSNSEAGGQRVENALPSGLRFLQLSSGSLDFTGRGPEIFPNGLLTLSMKIMINPGAQHDASVLYWNIPPHLTKLVVLTWRCEWFELLPRSLTSMETSALENVHDTALASGSLFAALPPNLTKFNTYSGYSSGLRTRFKEDKLPAQRLSHLSQLKELALYIGTFPSSMLRELPRTLRVLNITLSTVDDEDAPFLPPLLEDFYLGGAFLSESAAIHLPLHADCTSSVGSAIWEKKLRDATKN